MNDIEVLEDINYINEILKEKLSADEYGKVVTRVSIIKADLKERQSDKERIKDLTLNEKEKEIIETYRNLIKETGLESWIICNPETMWCNYFIPKSLIKEKIEEYKAKTDCRYCNNSCDSYAVCKVLEELLKGE